jgi:hypothetical protein
MATRFRLPSTGSPSVSPAFQSYTHSAALTRRTLPTTDDSALFTETRTADVSDHLVAGDSFLRQFVSNPMAAGIDFTTSDTVKYAVQASESNNGNNLSPQLWVGVYSQDGSTLQATLLAKSAHGTEVTTSVINRTKSASIASNYTTVSGDRLVVEFSLVGTPTNSGGTQGHNGSFRFGSDGASGDLPEDNTTTTTTFNPWIEFSPTITFGADAALTGQAITGGTGTVTVSDSSGQSFAASIGSLGAAVSPTSLGGQAVTTGQGTVTVSLSGGGNLTLGITGVEATFFHTPGAVKSATALSGQASTTQTGTVVGGIAGDGGAQLDGAVATLQSGTLIPNLESDDTYIASATGAVVRGITKALTGSAITSADGLVSASAADITFQLNSFGDEVSTGSGTATANLACILTGVSADLAQESMSAPGRVDLIGQSATVEQGFFGRSYALSGEEISSATDFMEASGFVPVVGDSSTGQLYTFEDLALPKTLAITGIAISSEQGILVPVPSVEWIKKADPDSMWTKPANPNSAWVKKASPSSEWNKK